MNKILRFIQAYDDKEDPQNILDRDWWIEFPPRVLGEILEEYERPIIAALNALLPKEQTERVAKLQELFGVDWMDYLPKPRQVTK